MKKKLLSFTLALMVLFSMAPAAVFANELQDAPEDAAAKTILDAADIPAEQLELPASVQLADEEFPADDAEFILSEPDSASAGQTADDSVVLQDDTDDGVALREEAVTEALQQVAIGGVNYYYADVTDDDPMTVYQATVRSKKGSTVYDFTLADMTQLGETSYYYVLVPGATALTGTLYGYGEGTATTYKEVYAKLGVETDDSYDVISSATNYTSHHAGDIPSLTVFGTDADGNKAITGLTLGRSTKSVDAAAYVEASILKAAGEELTEAQAAALDITLKANPMTAPSETTIAAKFGSAEYTLDKYGTGAFNIYPDDSVEGYVWNEYLDSIYAATISDGTNTAGAVYWVDLYGEKATTPGYHYNKVELELNNGTSAATNLAEVNRYKAFFDEKTGELKPGTYTISVYAEGYDTVTGSITVGISLNDKTAEYTGTAISAEEASLSGITGEIGYAYFSDEACTQAMEGAPVDPGTYFVKASAAGISTIAKLTISPMDLSKAAVTLDKSTIPYTGKALNPGVKSVKIGNLVLTGNDYTVSYKNNTNTGTATVTVTGKGNYAGSASATFEITKANQPMTAKGATKKIKLAKLKKKAQTVAKAVTVKNAKGKVTYKKTKGNNKIRISKAGKITVKKGLKKGTYPVTIQVNAAGDANYLAGSKTVTVKIKVN